MKELINIIDRLDVRRDFENTNKIRLAKLIVLNWILGCEGVEINLDILYGILGEKLDYPKSICQSFETLNINTDSESVKALLSLYVMQGDLIKPVSDYIRAHA